MNYKQYKAIFESFKKKSKKNYYSDFIIQILLIPTNIISKNT